LKNQITFKPNIADENATSIDIRELIFKFLRYWYLFVLVSAVSFTLAFLYLRYTYPLYESSATILIKDEKEGGQISEETILEGMGLNKGDKNIENEILILKSSLLMYEVVKNLQLQYQYFSKGRFHKLEYYTNSPVQVINWVPNQIGTGFTGEILPDNQGAYSLIIGTKKFKGEFGKELKIEQGTLTLSWIANEKFINSIILMVNNPEDIARGFASRLMAVQVNNISTALKLSFKDTVAKRAKDILTELMKVYNQQTIQEKNKIVENTLRFIDERIKLLTGELSDAETGVEQYKKRFKFVDLSAEGGIILGELGGYNNEITTNEVQLAILKSIEDFLLKNKNNFEFVPNNLTLTNLTLTSLLGQFNQLLTERERMRTIYGPAHKDIQFVEKQIQNLRQTIIDNIQSIKKDLKITKNATLDRRNSLETRLLSLPQRERELVEIQRQKNIKENLYLVLLQKREEAALTLAIAVASSRTIEPTSLPGSPVSPNRKQIWILALLAGIVLQLKIFDHFIHQKA